MTKKIATSPLRKVALISLRRQFTGNTAAAQRVRLQAALGIGPINTYQAMRLLDIYHPPARIRELRNEGYEIRTHWVKQVTEAGKSHRIGLYVLHGSPRPTPPKEGGANV